MHITGLKDENPFVTLEFYEGAIRENTCEVSSSIDEIKEAALPIEIMTKNHRNDSRVRLNLNLLEDKDSLIEKSTNEYNYYLLAKLENTETGELERLACC